MRTKLLVALALLCFLVLIGCTEKINPGYVGMLNKTTGLTGEVLEPGNHSCWGRDAMIRIETLEFASTEEMAVLCKDDLNFKFDLKLRTRLKRADGEAIKQILNAQGSKMSGGILSFQVLYNTYVKDISRATARAVVSKYETIQVRDNREDIEGGIWTQLVKALEGTPVELVMVATSNFDYPPVITTAMEVKKEREIEIGQERARQAMRLLEVTNRLKIAQKLRTVRAAEAQAEAAYMEIMGKSLTAKFLRLKEIEAKVVLYERTGQGDKVIAIGTTGSSIIPMIGTR